MPKDRNLRRIDTRPPVTAGVVTASSSSVSNPAPPVYADTPVPTDLALTTDLYRSAVTPSALIGATWTPPLGLDLLTYALQWSTDSTFATDVAGTEARQPSATIENLKTATLYYVRVAAVYRGLQSAWTAAASITTDVDTVAPDPVTAQTAAFFGVGDLIVTWTNPASANFRDVEITIYASNGGTLLAQVFNATGHFIWPAAVNLMATGGAGDPSLYVTFRAHSWGNIFSSSVNASAVKAVPTAPTVSVDFTGADAVYTITPPSDAAYLNFIADGGVTVRRLAVVGRYAYVFDQNRLDHSGTPDPVLAYSFTAVDGLNQASTATTGTATNAAPSAPTVTLIGGQNQLVAQVTSAMAADFLAYEYVWKKDTIAVLTQESASAEQQYAAQAGDEGAHSWTCTVRQRDVFLQYSTATTSSAVMLDALTIAYLRAGLIYSDSVGTAQATLNTLKDDDKDSGGVSYAA